MEQEDTPEETPANVSFPPDSPDGEPTEAEPPKPETPDKKDSDSKLEPAPPSPSPSAEQLPKDELDKIIKETLEILQFCQRKVDEQKIDSHSLGFMLLRIKESLDAYINDYIPKLNAFLVHADLITAEYYAQLSNTLRCYGDYVKALEADPNDTIEAGTENPVLKEDLHTLVKTVTDNYYAGGMFLKSGRMVFKDINNSQPDRQDIVDKVFAPMPSWLTLQNSVTKQLESIREQTFKISAYVDFLKHGESKMAPSLDLSALNTSENKQQKQNS